VLPSRVRTEPLAGVNLAVNGVLRTSPSDDANLNVMRLPGSSALKTIASSGVRGIVIAAATRDELLRWLNDPLVCSINPAEVAFNVGIGTSSSSSSSSVGEP
jgi:hypothetical protein